MCIFIYIYIYGGISVYGPLNETPHSSRIHLPVFLRNGSVSASRWLSSLALQMVQGCGSLSEWRSVKSGIHSGDGVVLRDHRQIDLRNCHVHTQPAEPKTVFSMWVIETNTLSILRREPQNDSLAFASLITVPPGFWKTPYGILIHYVAKLSHDPVK